MGIWNMATEEKTISTLMTASGMPVVVDPMRTRTAGAMVCIGVGSRDEKTNLRGASHLLEHMLFKGTGARTYLDISKEIEGAGGELNGFTSKEMTAYYVATLNRTLPACLDVLQDMILDSRMEDRWLELERQVVLQEIDMWRNDPEGYIHTLFSRSLFEGHPMSNDEAGDPDTVASITRDQLFKHMESNYSRPRLAVVASGNVDADSVLSWAEDSFDGLGGAAPRPREAPTMRGAGIDHVPREGDHAYVALGFPGLSTNDPDRHSLTLMSAILGSGMSSRLFTRVREELGLVYSIYTLNRQYSDCGQMTIFFSTSEDHVTQVVSESVSQMRSLKEHLQIGELNRARNMLQGSMVRRMESTENRMYRMGRGLMTAGKVRSQEEDLAALDAVTEEDVLRIAAKVLDPSKLRIVTHSREPNGLDLHSLDF